MDMALSGKSARFEGVHCTLLIEQPATTVVLLKISGTYTGEFGGAPLKALEECLSSTGPVDVFIDARDVRGASIDVSAEWAAWLIAHRQMVKTITMLTGTRFIQITGDFVRRFAGLNGIMWVCTEPAVFDLALAQAQGR